MQNQKDEIYFEALCSRYASKNLIPYEELLRTFEWSRKRNEILSRDQNICRKCKRKATKSFNVKSIQEIFKTNLTMSEWHVVGSDFKLPGHISDGHYWFFSIETLNKFRSSYWDLRYLKYKTEKSIFVLIRSSERYFLQVHHKLYIVDKMPWEYHDSDLQTMCNRCHWETHQTEKINTYKIMDGKLCPTSLTPCIKCKGAGWLPQFDHVQNGICFMCMGRRYFNH